LTTREAVIRHQDGFNPAHLGGGFPEPSENRIFLVTRGARYTTNTIAFSELGQRFDDVSRRGLAPIKQGPFRRRERALTAPTLIPLLAVACATKLDDVPLRCGLWLPVIDAVWIGTEIARLC
jgi:hypothetical protein